MLPVFQLDTSSSATLEQPVKRKAGSCNRETFQLDTSSSVRLVHEKNIPFILVTLLTSQFATAKVSKLAHPLNIDCVVTMLPVFQLDTSSSATLEQSVKRKAGSCNRETFQLDTSRAVSAPQERNVSRIETTFAVLHLETLSVVSEVQPEKARSRYKNRVGAGEFRVQRLRPSAAAQILAGRLSNIPPKSCSLKVFAGGLRCRARSRSSLRPERSQGRSTLSLFLKSRN